MLNSIFSDNMMLQCEQPIRVWGKDLPNQPISVKLADNFAETKTDNDGEWQVILPALKIATVCDMEVTGSKKRHIKNILLGDVWLCSGQSNMEFSVKEADNALEEISKADFPEIRFFTVKHIASVNSATEVEGEWQICSPKTVAELSAVGYFFARDINIYQHRPIGLIHSSWGGTRIEAWMSKESLQKFDFMQKELADYEVSAIDKQTRQVYEEDLKEWRKQIPKDPKNTGFDKGYATLSYDDSDWKTLKVPGWWTQQGLDFNGVLWYRKAITLPESWLDKDCVLHLGPCDKSDQTYFNNCKIGELSIEENPDAYKIARVYQLPKGIINKGKNIIAVRIFSNVNGGGFASQPDDMFIALKDNPEERICLGGQWRYKIEYNFGKVSPPVAPFGEMNPNSPYILYDNMIKPLLACAIKGILWYQGETNAKAYQYYKQLFLSLINHWRYDFNLGEIPFYFVQLANFGSGTDSDSVSPWAEIRKAQESALELNNTGMAVAIDVGNPIDIHPTNKQAVGKRLALIARAKTYGEDIEYQGAIVDTAKLEHDKIVVTFKHAENLTTSCVELVGFEVLVDGVWDKICAIIKNDTIVLTCAAVNKVKKIRYAYCENPQCSIQNKFNLPMRPFTITLTYN